MLVRQETKLDLHSLVWAKSTEQTLSTELWLSANIGLEHAGETARFFTLVSVSLDAWIVDTDMYDL